MAATQHGQDLIVGVGQTMGSYIVERYQTGSKDVHSEDVRDEDGKLKTRIIMDLHAKISLSLIAMTGATPESDFVVGSICAIAPISNFYIEDCQISRVEGARRITVEATNLGIT